MTNVKSDPTRQWDTNGGLVVNLAHTFAPVGNRPQCTWVPVGQELE